MPGATYRVLWNGPGGQSEAELASEPFKISASQSSDGAWSEFGSMIEWASSREPSYAALRALVQYSRLRPIFQLESTYPVKAEELAKHLVLQYANRSSGSSDVFPVQVIPLGAGGKKSIDSVFAVTPLRDLPDRREYELRIAQELRESNHKALLSEVVSFSFDTGTEGLKIMAFEPVEAYGWGDIPLPEDPSNVAMSGFMVKFNRFVDASKVDPKLITVEPKVNLSFSVSEDEEEEFYLRGNFEPGVSYRFRFDADVASEDGVYLGQPVTLTRTALTKEAQLIFPSDELWQRSGLGLHFAFHQIRMGPVVLRIAEIPFDSYANVMGGWEDRSKALIPAFRLPVRYEHTFPQTTGRELREVRFRPEGGLPDGMYLVEALGKTLAGEIMTNRTLAICSNVVIAAKSEDESRFVLRGFDAGTGAAVPLSRARFFTANGVEDYRGRNGLLTFPADALDTVEVRRGGVMIEAQGRASLLDRFYDHQRPDSLRPGRFQQWSDHEYRERGAIFTDRPLYRPGDPVHFLGVAREISPSGADAMSGEIDWSIQMAGETVYQGTSRLTAVGCFSDSWTLPADLEPGTYVLSTNGGRCEFFVDDYQKPAFSVVVSAEDVAGETPRAEIVSVWPDGGPNAGAEVNWRAIWVTGDDPFEEEKIDLCFENEVASPFFLSGDLRNSLLLAWKNRSKMFSDADHAEVSNFGYDEGVGRTDADGILRISSRPAFARELPRRAKIFWMADVKASTPGGATVVQSGGDTSLAQRGRQVLATRISQPTDALELSLEAKSWSWKNEESHGVPIRVTLKKVDVKVSTELARNEVRSIFGSSNRLATFTNKPVSQTIWSADAKTPFQELIPVPGPGHYLVEVSSADDPLVAPVSQETLVSGLEAAELVVNNDLSLRCSLDRPRYSANLPEKDRAVLTIGTPFPGTAWVTVESDRILHEQTIEIPGNTARVEIPIEPSFFPNAFVMVYLVHGGGTDDLPVERFGGVPITVDDPARTSRLTVTMERGEVLPGDRVRGVVELSDYDPAQGSEVTVFAVDTAVQQLRRWSIPDFKETFFPGRNLYVTTYHGAKRFIPKIEPFMIFNKGFEVGDAGMGVIPNSRFRREEKPLAYWKAHQQPDRNGRVAFEFKAPADLTQYRVYAVAASRDNRFGWADANFYVTHPLTATPLYPGRLNVGDEPIFRTVLKNSSVAPIEIDLVQELPATLQAVTSTKGKIRLDPGQSEVWEVKARAVRPGRGEEVKVTLTYRSFGRTQTDELLAKLDVHDQVPSIQYQLAGRIPRTSGLDLGGLLKPSSASPASTCDVFVSTIPFVLDLPKLHSVAEEEAVTWEGKFLRHLALTSLARMANHHPTLVNTWAYPPVPVAKANSFQALIAIAAAKEPLSRQEALLGAWAAAEEGGKGLTAARAYFERAAAEIGSSPVDSNPALEFFAAAQLQRQLRKMSGSDGAWGHMLDETIGQLSALIADHLDNQPLALCARLALHPDQQAALASLLRSRESSWSLSAAEPSELAKRCLARARLLRQSMRSQEADRLRVDLEKIIAKWTDQSLETKVWALLAIEAIIDSGPAAEAPKDPIEGLQPFGAPNRMASAWLDVPVSPIRGVQGTRLFKNYAIDYRVAGSEPFADPALGLARPSIPVRRELVSLETLEPIDKLVLGESLAVIYEVQAPATINGAHLVDPLPGCFRRLHHQGAEKIARDYASDHSAVALIEKAQEQLDGRTWTHFGTIPNGTSVSVIPVQVTCAGTYQWPAAKLQSRFEPNVYGFSDAAKITVLAR